VAAREALCGILNVDKPLGLTSHEVVVAVRKLSGQRRVGHAGTLDPLATGVLLLCLGKATRVSQYLMASPKAYRATVRLGISTTTHDAEGQITSRSEVCVQRQELKAALQPFVGHVDQVPPAYSAIKRKGKRMYELARQGIPVQVPSRKVDVYALRLVDWAPPDATLDVECGPGTYIRALARDLGRALGCGAHLAALRRTQSGQFSVQQAASLDDLEGAFAAGTAVRLLYPLDAAFAQLPALYLDADAAHRLAMGQAVRASDAVPGEALAPGQAQPGQNAPDQTKSGQTWSGQARAYGPGNQFVALVSREQATAPWQPRKVFVDPQDILSVAH
jgi:tRNA pseudouridine55 synthase